MVMVGASLLAYRRSATVGAAMLQPPRRILARCRSRLARLGSTLSLVRLQPHLLCSSTIARIIKVVCARRTDVSYLALQEGEH